jgi:hypothetical protein
VKLTFMLLVLTAWLAPAVSRADSSPTNHLSWLARSDRVDVRIQGWPLGRVLSRIAKETGWEIRIEPGTQRTVTAGFSGLSQREALSRLLGNLNFAVISRSNAPSRLLVFRSTRESATERVEAEADESNAGPIREEFVLRVKAGLKIKPGEMARIAKLFGGTLVAGIDELGAYRLRFPDEASATKAREAVLKANDSVTAEDNCRVAQPELPPELQTGTAAAASASGVVVPPLGGKDGPVIALIDTAVQGLPADMETLILSRTQLAPGTPSGNELAHGTSMAQAMIAGMQEAGQAVRVRSYDVYGGGETTSTFDVAKGLLQAARDGATVFNLSLGSYTPSPILSDISRQIASRGGVIFAAAGNQRTTRPVFPAADPWILAVTAKEADGSIAPWANVGSFVDLAAPASAVVTYGNELYRVSGTSTASAWTSGYTAGLAVRNQATPSATVSTVQSQLGFSTGKP